MTQRRNPEERNLELHHRENLKIRTISKSLQQFLRTWKANAVNEN